jgi:hypothetical protein
MEEGDYREQLGFESDYPQSEWDVKRQTGYIVGREPVLFLDDSYILDREGVERSLHPLSKEPDPVTFPLPFEGIRIPIVRSIVPATDQRWFYAYVSGGYGDKTLFMLYRTRDCVDFRPVEVNQLSREEISSQLGRTEIAFNNLLIFDEEHGRKFPPYYCAFFRVYHDTDYPYEGVVINKNPRPRVARVIRSRDGINWEEKPDQPRKKVSFESNMPAYDAFRDRYLLYLRLWDPPKKPVSGWRKVLLSQTGAEDPVAGWTDEELVLEADELDGPAADIYFMQVTGYAGIYVGIPAIYQRTSCFDPSLRGTIHGQLAVSGDGRSWSRVCQGEQFLVLGEEGSWDSGLISPACAPVILGEELIYYYSGRRIRHDEPLPEDYSRGCGLARLRLDGFASLDAGPIGGTVLTVPFWPEGKYLYVNADASEGEIRVEVLQDYTYVELKKFERGKPGRGLFRAEKCIPLNENSTCHRVEWENGENFIDDFPAGWNRPQSSDDLKGMLHFSERAIALTFYLRNAKLYSFWFADSEGPPEEGRLKPAES